jgi:hypothetical protein
MPRHEASASPVRADDAPPPEIAGQLIFPEADPGERSRFVAAGVDLDFVPAPADDEWPVALSRHSSDHPEIVPIGGVGVVAMYDGSIGVIPRDEHGAYFTTCRDCEDCVSDASATSINWNESLCPHCYEGHYCSCETCGTVIHNDDSCYSEVTAEHYCESCHSELFTACEDCGCELRRRDAWGHGGESYCGACYDSLEIDNGEDDDDDDEDNTSNADRVLNYGANVLDYCKTFLGTPPDGIYVGVENEIEVLRGDHNDRVHAVRALLGKDYAICKHDGSINSGFEIVTAPASLDVARQRWGHFLRNRPEHLEAGRNGLHVHVSRRPLGRLAVGKIASFVNASENSPFITAIAGRSGVHWARRYDKPVSRAESREKYEAVNTSRSSTIEFRIFHSTLNAERMIARLEFVVALCRWCKFHASLSDLKWDAFARHVEERRKDYPKLHVYLRRHRIDAASLQHAESPEPALA